MRIQLIPDARVATLTQKSRKMAKMQKPVLAKPIGRQKPCVCAQRSEHIARPKARIERERNRASKARIERERNRASKARIGKANRAPKARIGKANRAPKARIEPNGQNRAHPAKNEKNACREFFLLTRCANAAKRRLVPDELKSSEGMRNVGH